MQLRYTMPFVVRESQRDRLRRERQLLIADALQITHEVADALSCAHEQGGRTRARLVAIPHVEFRPYPVFSLRHSGSAVLLFRAMDGDHNHRVLLVLGATKGSSSVGGPLTLGVP
jgi:hypothetical protein